MQLIIVLDDQDLEEIKVECPDDACGCEKYQEAYEAYESVVNDLLTLASELDQVRAERDEYRCKLMEYESAFRGIK
jgi:hypothetical protein